MNVIISHEHDRLRFPLSRLLPHSSTPRHTTSNGQRSKGTTCIAGGDKRLELPRIFDTPGSGRSLKKGQLSDIHANFEIIRIGNFYDLDMNKTWQRSRSGRKQSPGSYAAHLVLGVYFQRKGFDARGDELIVPNATREELRDRMRQYLESKVQS